MQRGSPGIRMGSRREGEMSFPQEQRDGLLPYSHLHLPVDRVGAAVGEGEEDGLANIGIGGLGNEAPVPGQQQGARRSLAWRIVGLYPCTVYAQG
jgi:hypothetical protein